MGRFYLQFTNEPYLHVFFPELFQLTFPNRPTCTSIGFPQFHGAVHGTYLSNFDNGLNILDFNDCGLYGQFVLFKSICIGYEIWNEFFDYANDYWIGEWYVDWGMTLIIKTSTKPNDIGIWHSTVLGVLNDREIRRQGCLLINVLTCWRDSALQIELKPMYSFGLLVMKITFRERMGFVNSFINFIILVNCFLWNYHYFAKFAKFAKEINFLTGMPPKNFTM